MAQRKPLISVVIPLYNRARLIKKAVESVLNQSFKDIELFVVDDGSTDEPQKVLQTITDSRLKTIYLSNQGVSCARNKGIQAAQGEWIAFLDSDDLWLPNKLEAQLLLIEKQKTFWTHGEEIWIRNSVRVNPHKKHQKQGGRIYLASLPLCVVSPSAVMIHKNIFQTAGLFDPLLPAAEDYDLWLRISSRYEISYTSEFLIEKYGGHEDQLSRSFLGLDRFRVRALKKQLDSKYLTQEEIEATRELFETKCKILATGYKKHGKILTANYYENL